MANYSTGATNNAWRGGPATVPCASCGEPFTAPRWQLNRGRKFCTTYCNLSLRPSRARPHLNQRGYRLLPTGVPHELVKEHRAIVERALAHPLRASAPVHHVNGDRADNRHGNLVACDSQAYHILLHARQRVFRAGGRPGRDKICCRCKQLKPVGEFYRRASNGDGLLNTCKPCHNLYRKEKMQCPTLP